MNAAAAAAAVVVTLCSMASCEPPTSSTTDVDVVTSSTVYIEHRPPCLDAVVTVDYDAAVSCDVTPPQRLDVVYPVTMAYDDAARDCGEHGGSLVLVLPRVCRDVDY